MNIGKYFASCGYMFVHKLIPALYLAGDKTMDGADVVNVSIDG